MAGPLDTTTAPLIEGVTVHLLDLVSAARQGRRTVRRARKTGYHTEFARLTRARTGRVCTHPVHTDVQVLRALWRLGTADRHPDEEPIFLAAALRAHGRDAVLVIGRETAPPDRDAQHPMWVTVDGAVVSTGLPVAELCTSLATLP
ncbi:hypothetical protein [Nocardia transvalensis]|uniref:hypothetical protein n=1 Tax=Nocardia transvalensis TaxID=37333 RepID=UPI001894C960|nr:hypothetical protein [Nocardia transvalensis]MBF6331073.1 hypothetical protein [Nocardia transvalensis]